MERLRSVLAHRQHGLRVVIENVHDPHNVAAVMRSCDATGVLDLHLVYTREPFPDFAKVGISSSAGTKKWVRIHKHESVDDCYNALRAEGFRIYASRLDRTATELYRLVLTQRVAVVFGNESLGVSDEATEKADGCYIIPMVGMVQSLNISVAAAVTLYEAYRQRRAAGLYDQASLPEAEFNELLAAWSAK